MIKIIWATARPKMFIERHRLWMSNASGKYFIHTSVAVNTQEEKDEILHNYDEISQGEIDFQVDIKVTGDDNLGVCKPVYELTKDLKLAKDSDIVIVVCDDVNCPVEWDVYLVNEFLVWDGALMIRDGYQHYTYNTRKTVPAVSMPTLTYGALKKMNMIIFHPDYKHYFADNELFTNLTEMGLMKDERSADSVVFEHMHYSPGKRLADDLDRNIQGLGNQDRAMYHKRKGLPVEKRIQLNSFE